MDTINHSFREELEQVHYIPVIRVTTTNNIKDEKKKNIIEKETRMKSIPRNPTNISKLRHMLLMSGLTSISGFGFGLYQVLYCSIIFRI